MTKNKLTLITLLAMSLAPILLGTILYLYFPIAQKNNYGTLVQPQKDLPNIHINQQPFLSEFKGKWLMLIINSGQCNEECVKRLYIMRQLRATQGKEANRIVPIWLISDAHTIDPNIKKAYNDNIGGVKFIHLPAEHVTTLKTWLNIDNKQYHNNDNQHNIYILDPKQHLMMYYTLQQQQNPKGMIKDISKLLKWSSIG